MKILIWGATPMKSLLRRGLPMSTFLVLAVVLGLAFSAIVGQTAKADELYGRVRGLVSDSTGAVLPGVQLRLTNNGTGSTVDVVSDSDGSFTFVNLHPGDYKLTAT